MPILLAVTSHYSGLLSSHLNTPLNNICCLHYDFLLQEMKPEAWSLILQGDHCISAKFFDIIIKGVKKGC